MELGPVIITKTIEKCGQCRHKDHSGMITRGRIYHVCHLAFPVLDNGAARNISILRESRKEQYGEKGQEHVSSIVPPDWCPLRQGKEY